MEKTPFVDLEKYLLTNKMITSPCCRRCPQRYGLGLQFLREEYATSYSRLQLPLPLPPTGDPDTQVTVGEQGVLPVYTSLTAAQQEGQAALESHCADCAECRVPFDPGVNVMRCYACGMMAAHVRCLARRFVSEAGDPTEIVPREGYCPRSACAQRLLWATLVREVTTYRPPASVERYPDPDSIGSARRANSVEDGWGGVGGGVGQVSPRVWLVDDSSDDDNDDGESECGASEDGRQYDRGGYHSDGSKEDDSDVLMEPHQKGQDTWVSVEHRVDGWSQGTVQGGVSDVLGVPTSPWRCSGRVAGGDDLGSIVGSGVGGGGTGRDEQSPPSPPMLPLSERLRLRRYAATQHG